VHTAEIKRPGRRLEGCCEGEDTCVSEDFLALINLVSSGKKVVSGKGAGADREGRDLGGQDRQAGEAEVVQTGTTHIESKQCVFNC